MCIRDRKDSGAEILICTKSDLVVRDIDLLREMGKVTVSWSINTPVSYTHLHWRP